MHAILLTLRRTVRTTADKGASAVEYGLMVAAIAALIVGTVFALGGFVKDTFDKTCNALNTPSTAGCKVPDAGTGGTSTSTSTTAPTNT
jgi:pilus assembly protein Flp/PilA